MPAKHPQTARTPGPETYKLPGVPRVFGTRQAAIDFLRGSPKQVARTWNELHRNFPKLLLDAGITRGAEGIRLTKVVPFKMKASTKDPAERYKAAAVAGYVGGGNPYTGATKPTVPTAQIPAPPKVKPKPKPTPAAKAPPSRSPVVTSGAGTVDTSGGYSAPTVDTTSLDSLNPDTQKMISASLANSGAKLYGSGAADAQAGLAKDAEIQSLQDAAARNPLDTQQHQKDIGSWYQQVLGSLKTAGERDAAISKAAVGETQGNTQALISAIGGSANAGSGLVGAAGEQAAGTLGALGSAQDQYNADLAPILQAEAAAQKTREGARGSGQLHDLQLQIAAALGQRGQAKAVAQMNIDQANNAILDNRASRLIDILGRNNASKQTNYANTFGHASTIAGLQATGAKTVSAAAQNYNDNAAKIEVARIRASASASKKSSGARPTFSSPQGLRMQKDAYANYQQWLSNNGDTLKQLTPQQRLLAAGNYINKSYGWSQRVNPDVANFIQTGLRSAKLY